MKALLPLLVVLLTSCTSTTVDEFRQGETGINSDESIVILGRRHSSDYETRAEFVDCVGERMTSGNDSISVIPEKEFVDAMFPWFEPRTAPLRTRDLERLMAEPVVADKMAEFGVRYMVWLDGFTETSGRTGTISCTVGPGGAGCFGFGSWEDDSTFDARVWDVASLQKRRHDKHRRDRPVVSARARDSYSAHRASRGQCLRPPCRSAQTICKRRMI